MKDPTINWDAVDEYLQPIYERMALNVRETGNPYHHRTRNGAIIGPDPRLPDREHFTHLWLCDIPVELPKPWARPLKGVPVIPDWYNTKAGKKWLKEQSSAGVVEAIPQQASLW